MHVKLVGLLALLGPNLTQRLVLCWLACIVAIQPQVPRRPPPLHDISIDEDETEVDFREHDWRFIPEPTPELPEEGEGVEDDEGEQTVQRQTTQTRTVDGGKVTTTTTTTTTTKITKVSGDSSDAEKKPE
ncbi:hypothetical protein L9F63_023517 [Diploptera punctata]|uniref:Uncharacterized protein n=1 Tax=Diploptera punctata TaxID=6984 RepID=A0AAD7ZJ66_DIPPU|nr:hypothetical protein L9F63_023517 [Diploptera punctata]